MYTHNDPLNEIDPSGQFAIAISISIAFGFGYGMQARKNASDIATGTLIKKTLLGMIYGYIIGYFLECLLPTPFRHPTLGAPSFHVTQDDIDYAHRINNIASSTTNIYSTNNRRVIDLANNNVNRIRLLNVIQIIRATESDCLRTDTCNNWVFLAATRIHKLPKNFWDNDDYVIEQVLYQPTTPGLAAEHALLMITNKRTGQIAFFDNGGFGDTNVNYVSGLKAEGGIAFPEDIPNGWSRSSNQSLDEILSQPGRLEGLLHLTQ
jgi:hypothetical protein